MAAHDVEHEPEADAVEPALLTERLDDAAELDGRWISHAGSGYGRGIGVPGPGHVRPSAPDWHIPFSR